MNAKNFSPSLVTTVFSALRNCKSICSRQERAQPVAATTPYAWAQQASAPTKNLQLTLLRFLSVLTLACVWPIIPGAMAQSVAKMQSTISKRIDGKTPVISASAKKPVSLPAKVAPLDFDRDVRPVLAENCFACHGFDANKRVAGLRLDREEGALKKLDSGRFAIVAGDLKNSELMERITATGPLQMPSVASGKKVSAAQIATLKRWILQGGHYAKHWAYIPPTRPALPAVTAKNTAWVRNPIDRFVLARLEKEGLTASPEADRSTLIRRATLDLTGLPPTPQEVDAFLADKSPNAYEKMVDRLLANPHYGERMALAWLDLARYADTHGYHIDSQRDMWRWREWVINAFNTNLPYDQFTLQQLAGDMLPKPTLEQKIASGYNRNHPIDFEGGAIPEEYAAAYIFDRIDTTATTFMGMTMRCAQCHDHKYDPITQKDYYRFFALFHNVPEAGLDGQKGNAVPFIKAPSPEQEAQVIAFASQMTGLENARKNRQAESAPMLAEWLKTASANAEKTPLVSAGLVADYALDETTGAQVHDALNKQPVGAIKGKADWKPGKLGNALNFDGATYVEVGDILSWERNQAFSYGAWIFPTGMDSMTVLSRMNESEGFRGYDMYLQGGKAFVHLLHQWDSNAIRVNTKVALEPNKWHHLFATYDGSSKAKGVHIYVDGKPADLDYTHDTLTESIRTTAPFTIGRRTPGAPFKGLIDEVRVYDRELTPAEVGTIANPDVIKPLLAIAEAKRTEAQKAQLATYYLENVDDAYKKLTVEWNDIKRKQAELDSAIPTTMVMQEMDKPRDTFILLRGQYDKPGEKVTAGLPEFLPALGTYPPNRLGLAQWLTNPNHPLTGRVAVNRYWQMVFGTGLVKTAEDFGTQGERPSHPELLDWLATTFAQGTNSQVVTVAPWDVKGMLRLIITSATYRQSSHVTPKLQLKDPENRLLARGPRFRLPAEAIHDEALAVAGLLTTKIGGPSVKPYQPAGLWEEMAFGGGFSAQSYQQDHGENLYRRGMYTFWKRTVPPPSLQMFDAPEREFCMVRRSVTNTPLQALALMNDPTYVEASRKLAERMLIEGGISPAQRINYAYRLCVARSATPAEQKVLTGLLTDQLTVFRKDPKTAEKLLAVGEAKRNEKLDAAELAAWTIIAGTILNLDETITKN